MYSDNSQRQCAAEGLGMDFKIPGVRSAEICFVLFIVFIFSQIRLLVTIKILNFKQMLGLLAHVHWLVQLQLLSHPQQFF